MRVLIIIILMALAPMQQTQAQSAIELIETHRQWMKECFPKPDTLSKRALLKEAALTVSYGLREPEAKALLLYAAKDVPQLNDYVAWLGSDRPDYHFSAAIAATKAIAETAERLFGKYDDVTAWSRHLYIEQLSSMQCVVPLAEDMIKDQEEAVRKHHSRETKALLCIMKLATVEYKTWEDFVSDPKEYDSILRVENDALTIYPLDDDDVNLTRAMLYYYLGMAKDCMSSSSYEYELAQDKAGWRTEPMYSYTVQGVKSNANYYLENVCDLFKQMYSEGHPMYFMACVNSSTYKIQNFPTDQEDIDVIDNLRLYADNYFPKDSYDRLLLRYKQWQAKLYAGQPNYDAMLCWPVVNEFKNFLGEDNKIFHSILSLLTVISATYYPFGSDEILLYYDTIVDKYYAGQPICKVRLIWSAYFILKDRLPEKANKKLQEAAELYKSNHCPTPFSIEVGRILANDNYSTTMNYAASLSYQECVCQDVAGYYGDSSPVTLNEELNKIIITGYVDVSKPSELYPKLIDKMKACGVDYYNALRMYACFEYSRSDFYKSEKLYRQVIKEEPEDINLTEKASNRLFLEDVIGKNRGSRKERANLFKQAVRLMDEDKDTLNAIINNYEQAANYLIETGCYEDALGIVDRGIELSNAKTSNSINEDLLGLYTLKNSLLYNNLNDKVTAKRLMAQQVKEFNPDNQLYYSPVMLDFLWSCYWLVYQENDKDFVQLGLYLFPIMQITQSLYAQSGENKAFLMSYGIQAVNGFIRILGTLKDELRKMDMDKLSAQQRSIAESSMRRMDEEMPNFLEGMKKMEQDFHSYDVNYKKNVYYSNLISCLAIYYSVIEPDFAEAEKYRKYYSELQEDNTLLKFYALRDLGDFYLNNKKNLEALVAYQHAAAVYLKLQDKTLEESIIMVAAFCNIYNATKEYDYLLPHARRFYKYLKELLDRNFQLMTEQEQDNIMAKYSDPAGWYCYLLNKKPTEIAGEVYDAVLYRTGMQLRSQRETKEAIMNSGDKELIALVDSLNRMQDLVRRINITDYNTQQQEQAQIRAMSFQINNLEQQIIQQSEPYRKQHILNATWQQVRDKLGADEAAVEFVFSENDIMALVVRPGYSAPKAVFMTRADSLSHRLSALGVRKTADLAMRLYNDKAIDLYSLLWQPMEESLQGVHTVYFSAPGWLNNLSFAAFATPDGKYLIDKYDLCQLTTTAAILRPVDEEKPKSAVLMGNIFYSPRQQTAAKNGRRGVADYGERAGSIDDFSDRGVKADHFIYLDSTVVEIQNIEKEMLSHGIPHDSISRSQEMEATEKSFRSLVGRRPEVVHLATHGFFIANSGDALRIPFYANHSQYIENSMRRAGVALAGAEATWCGAEGDDSDDGILTAEEVSHLNMRNTRLVTLSACETALGDYSFEGVYGLPRGFKQAGVKSLLVSLWSVADNSTALLMSEFYRLWLGGEPMRTALRKAIDTVRSRYPQPYFWAPFVLLDACQDKTGMMRHD